MNHDAEWNAGELGCGELVLELRQRLRHMPGMVLKVIAVDAGAPGGFARVVHHDWKQIGQPRPRFSRVLDSREGLAFPQRAPPAPYFPLIEGVHHAR